LIVQISTESNSQMGITKLWKPPCYPLVMLGT